MCGICGIVKFDPGDPVARGVVESMNAVIAHRGPDDDGFFVEGNAGLGNRRLSIIDVGGGKQPIFNEDESAVIVFNGEVYNSAALSRDLAAAGHHFRTHCDTEAILHAYEEYSDDCVHRLRGMFAFAIWDRRRRRLLLARDRLGIKPVYFYQGPRFLAFGSEIKSLLELPEVPREVNPDALDLYLALRYVPGPQTMFRHIRKLQPGHLLTLEDGVVRMKKYWDIAYSQSDSRPPAYYVERFRELLDESVRLRLIAEVPLGVFLSGGIDSSAILATMTKLTAGERVKSFSVGYQASGASENQPNEFEFASLAANAFQADHHEFRLAAEDFRDFMPDLVWHLDEPLGDPSCIPLYFISKLARRFITVVLSGEGADEILAGYGIYPRMLALDRFYRHVPLASSLAPWLACVAPNELVGSYLRRAGLPLEHRYTGVSRAFWPENRRRLLGSNGSRSGSVADLLASYFATARHAGPLNQMLYVDAKVWLPDDLLLKADKMTMANSIELRVPFLDHKLVEFAATLPADLKLRRGTGKRLLRDAMAGVLPKPILTRPKKGFPVPTQLWFRTKLRDFTRDYLLASDSACRDYLDRQALQQLVQEHEEGSADRHQELFTLLVFEFWHRVFIDRRAKPETRRWDRLVEQVA